MPFALSGNAEFTNGDFCGKGNSYTPARRNRDCQKVAASPC
ncbi:hypothetical protein RU95_GL000525 [Enterococcus avium]|nr:hypothetical protein RU95_GL000525 [Enterococcus avium]